MFEEHDRDEATSPAQTEIARLKAQIAQLQQQLGQAQVKSHPPPNNNQLLIREERLRIARQLHDSLQQDLYGIELAVMTARQLLRQKKEEEVEAQLANILLTAEGALHELRSLIFDLRPDALAANGLVAGLIQQLTILRTRHHLEVESQLSTEPAIAPKIKEALYWITREAIQNVVKHAKATKVALKFSSDPTTGHLQLEIRDNGIGFDELQLSQATKFGLKSMYEQAQEVGLKLEIESNTESEGRGSVIRVVWPGTAPSSLSRIGKGKR